MCVLLDMAKVTTYIFINAWITKKKLKYLFMWKATFGLINLNFKVLTDC